MTATNADMQDRNPRLAGGSIVPCPAFPEPGTLAFRSDD
jgi:hypothetical protein